METRGEADRWDTRKGRPRNGNEEAQEAQSVDIHTYLWHECWSSACCCRGWAYRHSSPAGTPQDVGPSGGHQGVPPKTRLSSGLLTEGTLPPSCLLVAHHVLISRRHCPAQPGDGSLPSSTLEIFIADSISDLTVA